MTEESAKKASEILKRKSELNKDLSNLINANSVMISIEPKREPGDYFYFYDRGIRQNTNIELQNKVKELLIKETEQELEVLDLKLKALNC